MAVIAVCDILEFAILNHAADEPAVKGFNCNADIARGNLSHKLYSCKGTFAKPSMTRPEEEKIFPLLTSSAGLKPQKTNLFSVNLRPNVIGKYIYWS